MTSPQLENGYAKIANEILDALAQYRIPGEQMQCILFLFRRTYGWNKKEDEISMAEFSKATGVKRSNVSRALKALKEKQIISVIKTDNSQVSTYRFNKKYKEWQVLSKPITVIKTDNSSVIKTDNKVLSKPITPEPVSLSRKKIKESINKPPLPPTKKIEYTIEFESFWKAYPKKVGKIDAFKAWQKMKGVRPNIEKVVEAVEQQKESDQWQRDKGQYIPNPATWINQGRWDDEPGTGHHPGMTEILRHNIGVANRVLERRQKRREQNGE